MQVTLSQHNAVYKDSLLVLRNLMSKVHMVKQTILFSDGSEKVINYRGVIEDGVLIPDEPQVEEAVEEVAGAVEETVETPEVAEEAPAEIESA